MLVLRGQHLCGRRGRGPRRRCRTWSTEEKVWAGSTGWEVSGKENTLLGLFSFLWNLYWGPFPFLRLKVASQEGIARALELPSSLLFGIALSACFPCLKTVRCNGDRFLFLPLLITNRPCQLPPLFSNESKTKGTSKITPLYK